MIRLAAQRRLGSIENGAWATPTAQKLFVRLREACPDAADQMDYALACWAYWSSGKLDGVCEAFRRLGCGRELALAASKAGDLLVELKRIAENSLGSEAGRATAWHESAKQADRKDQRAEAAAAYLKTLENCAGGTKNAAGPPVRYFFTARLTVINGTPNARTMSACEAEPLTTS
jgi:hypothetical protein